MFRRLQFRLYALVHGEDVFDAWPGLEPSARHRKADWRAAHSAAPTAVGAFAARH